MTLRSVLSLMHLFLVTNKVQPFGFSTMSAIVHTHCYTDNIERHALAMCEFMCMHVHINACYI